jgi:hypothetical protein
MSAKFDLTPDGWLENEPRQVTTPPEDLEPGGDIDEELTVDGWIVQPIVAPTPGPPPPPPPPPDGFYYDAGYWSPDYFGAITINGA